MEDIARNNLNDLQNSIKNENQEQIKRYTDYFEEQQSRFREKEDDINRKFQYYQSRMEELYNEARIRNEQQVSETEIPHADDHSNASNDPK